MGETYDYDASVFVCATSEEAQSVILQPEIVLPPDHSAGMWLTTKERWQRETAYLAETIEWPDDTRLVIDYGCGIGRMMKVTAPATIGVDISPSMRAQGEEYLLRRQDCGFVSPGLFGLLIERGLRAQGAMAIWSLQHVLSPTDVIRSIFNALLPGAPFYVINRDNRVVPAMPDGRLAWVNDGVSITEAMESGGFMLVHEHPMPETLCYPGAWFRKYERAHV